MQDSLPMKEEAILKPCVRQRITERIWLRCYAPSLKLPSAISFIRRTLGEIAPEDIRRGEIYEGKIYFYFPVDV
jgi:hypothetical protein